MINGRNANIQEPNFASKNLLNFAILKLPLCVDWEIFTCTEKFGEWSLERFYFVDAKEMIFMTDIRAATKSLPGLLANATVGHQQREISGVTLFLLLWGGVIKCWGFCRDSKHRRSSVVQGSLVSPVKAIVEIDHQIVPATTLNLNNLFFNIRANAQDFFKNLPGKNLMWSVSVDWL